MNDKQQLAAMGEHLAEQQPLCMAKRIEELEAQVRVMVGLLRESIPYVEESADAAPSKQIAGYHETLVAHMKEALAGKLPAPVVPEDWKLVKKANCFVLIHDGQVIASIAGPTAERTAAIIASALDGRGQYNAAIEGWQFVPVEPTDDMLEMAEEAIAATGGLPEVWAEMLAAAPKPEAK